MEKSLSILLALKDHLQLSYPGLTTWTSLNDGTDVPVPVIQTDKTSKSSSLTITLKSSGKSSSSPDLTKMKKSRKVNEFQDLDIKAEKDITISTSPPSRLGRTFCLVFCPVAIVSHEMSCRCLLSVSLITHHGHILKKDFMTLTINFARSEILEQNVNEDEDLNGLDLAETSSSSCELLTKITAYDDDGFTLCEGIRHTSHKSLQVQSVFIEPSSDSDIVVRSRSCQFMIELAEMYPREENVSFFTTCLKCRELDASLTSSDLTSTSGIIDENSAFNYEFADIKLEKIEQSHVKSNEARNLLDDESSADAMIGPFEVIEESLSYLPCQTDQQVIVNGLTCQHCQRKFEYQQAFLKHIEKCFPPSHDMICTHCEEEFSNEADLMEHIELCEEGPAKFGCSKCQQEFLYEVNLLKHQEKCGKANKKAATGNIKKVAKKKASKRTSPKTKSIAVKNENVKNREIDVICPICLRHFFHEAPYQKHVELHGERIPTLYEKTMCPVWGCKLYLENRLDLNTHFLSDHCEGDFSDKILCAHCLLPVHQQKIRDHMRIEHPHQKYICTECGRECLFPSQLKQHWKDMHDPAMSKDYICELCGNVYARSTGLKQHMMSQHSEQRDFKCVHCGKGFTNAQRLRQHVRIHTGAKPFKCKLCEYRSNRSDNVLFHQRKVHKMTKPTVQKDVLVIGDDL